MELSSIILAQIILPMKRMEKKAYKQALKDLAKEFKFLIPMSYGQINSIQI